MSSAPSQVAALAEREYPYGFSNEIDTDLAPRGLSEEVISLISAKKQEPDWLLDWRLQAYRHWRTLTEPRWQNVRFDPIDYDDIIYYAAPKKNQLFYARQRGIGEEEAVSMIVNGFCREVFKELPMEFAVEAQRLLEVSLEGAVG